MHSKWKERKKEREERRRKKPFFVFTYTNLILLYSPSFLSERNTNVFNNKLDPTGPVYITIGDGGNREGLYNNWVDPQPAWSAYREAEYGHGVLTVLNDTHTFWEWHKNVDSEPVISDSAYFINTYQA
jgi:hypothetical protein